MAHLLSTKEFTKEILENILQSAKEMERQCIAGKINPLLENKIVACIFFEPSTRTRLSFETAALKLGAQVISVENASISSSAFKGETIEDTTRMLNCYADIIVIRHPKSGTAIEAAKVSTKPIINAGDGANQHPSQALLDVYTIKKEHGRLDNLTITFVGDLLYSRPLHSLMPLFNLYSNNKFYFVSPDELKLPKEFTDGLKNAGVSFVETNDLDEALPHTDVLYMTRVQKERFADMSAYEKVKDAFILKKEHMQRLNKNAIILHPLPRVNEIDLAIDADPRAAYFRQAQNGLYVRMALLLYVLGL